MASKEKKSRRRLQIDPEEYAPPTSLYDVSASPRPDAEWLKFYGGASEGAPKSLSSLDDEDGSEAAVPALPSLEATDLRSPSRSLYTDQDHLIARNTPAADEAPPNEARRTNLREINPNQAPPAALPFPTQKKPEVKEPRVARTAPNAQDRSVVPRSEDAVAASPTTATAERQDHISFKEFAARWRGLLTFGVHTGKLRICEVLYNNTYAMNRDTCFTSLDKLSKDARLDKRTCHINILQLEKIGFIERLAVFNTATKKGTTFKLHLSPLEAEAIKRPSRYLYEEDPTDMLL